MSLSVSERGPGQDERIGMTARSLPPRVPLDRHHVVSDPQCGPRCTEWGGAAALARWTKGSLPREQLRMTCLSARISATHKKREAVK